MQILKIAASNTVVNFVMQPWACSVREMFNPDTVPGTQALGSFNIAWPRELCSVQNEQRLNMPLRKGPEDYLSIQDL